VRCRIAKKLWVESTTYPAFSYTLFFNSLSFTAAIQSVKFNVVWSNCVHGKLKVLVGMLFDLMSSGRISRASRGERRTREIPLNYCE